MEIKINQDGNNIEAQIIVSSSGLRVFLNLRKEVIAKGGNLVLKNLTEEVHSVFTMTGFIKIFTIQ